VTHGTVDVHAPSPEQTEGRALTDAGAVLAEHVATASTRLLPQPSREQTARLTLDTLGERRTAALLDVLTHLDDIDDMRQVTRLTVPE
jgi:hypothetical protein